MKNLKASPYRKSCILFNWDAAKDETMSIPNEKKPNKPLSVLGVSSQRFLLVDDIPNKKKETIIKRSQENLNIVNTVGALNYYLRYKIF